MYNDAAGVSKVSFVPTRDQVDVLLKQSVLAETTTIRCDIHSKMYGIPASIGLCPDDLKPESTILTKLSNGPAGLKLPKFEGEKYEFAVLADPKMPLAGTSYGVNMVIRNPGNRINLFHRDVKTTHELARLVLRTRDANEKVMLAKLAKCMRSYQTDYVLDRKKKETLGPEHRAAYDDCCTLLELVSRQSDSLASCGMHWVTFCQTWCSKGSKVDAARFSVMSPHFQNTLRITHPRILRDIISRTKHSDRASQLIQSFTSTMHRLDENMEKLYGVPAGGPAFVNIDGLVILLGQEPFDVFFLLAAPTKIAVVEFRKFYVQASNPKLVICASLLEIGAAGKHVERLPTNLRAHFHKPDQSRVVQGGCDTSTRDGWLAAQEQVALSFAHILHIAEVGQVEISFAALPRSERQTCFTMERDSNGSWIAPTNTNQKTLESLPSVDLALSSIVLQRLIEPAYQEAKLNLADSIYLCTGGVRHDGSRWTGSWMVDPWCVLTGTLLGADQLWQSTSIYNHVGQGGTSKFWNATNVHHTSLGLEEDSDCTPCFPVYTLKARKDAMNEQMVKILTKIGELESGALPIFNSCFLWTDPFLNDIDDYPACYLAEALTRPGMLKADSDFS